VQSTVQLIFLFVFVEDFCGGTLPGSAVGTLRCV